MNLGIFSGRIGRDAEFKILPKGDRVANFPVAVEVGNKTEAKTMWLDCSMWGRRGEALQPHLVKGLKVTISGRVILEEFIKRDGVAGYRLAVNVDQLDFPGGLNERSTSAMPQNPYRVGKAEQ